MEARIKIPDLNKLKSSIDKIEGVKESLEKRKEALILEIDDLNKEEETLVLVVELLRQMADAEISKAVDSVESLLTEGLGTVFEDQNLEIKAEVRLIRGKVSVELNTIREYPDGTKICAKSVEGFGGSVTTIQSILLRIIVLLKHGLRPLLVLDESLMALESKYIPNVGKLLGSLCDRLGLDLLVITHNPELVDYAHNHWELVKENGSSTFRKKSK